VTLLGSGIGQRRALYTSGTLTTGDQPITAERRRTLETLIALAAGHSPNDCWDDRRAMDLLRSQSTPAELRELGAGEDLIEHVFAERA